MQSGYDTCVIKCSAWKTTCETKIQHKLLMHADHCGYIINKVSKSLKSLQEFGFGL